MQIDPKDIHEFMTLAVGALRPKNEWAEAIKTALWPGVVVLALFVFRRPLAKLFEGIGQHVTRFSVFDVSIELTSVAARSFSFSDLAVPTDDLRRGEISRTSVEELLKRIRPEGLPYYLVVNIGEGRSWLMSRLLLFTFVLWRIGAIHCVAFVDTDDGRKNRLLGLASPPSVCNILGNKYPWFDEALVVAWPGSKLPVPAYSLAAEAWAITSMLSILADPLPVGDAQYLVERFMSLGLIRQNAPQPVGEWVQFSHFWEHTKWLTTEDVARDLSTAFFPREESRFVDSVDMPASKRNKALLRRKAAFIALVNDQGELQHVVDRRAVMDSLAEQLRKEGDAE